MWHSKYDMCVSCNSVERTHKAKGLCVKCYKKTYDSKLVKTTTKTHNQTVKSNYTTYQNNKYFDGLRQSVLDRDNNQCVKCQSFNNLVVHHKDRTGWGKDKHNNTLENLETLCRACHIQEHQIELISARDYSNRPKLGKWSRKSDHCVSCKTTKTKHMARSLCSVCYMKICNTKQSNKMT